MNDNTYNYYDYFKDNPNGNVDANNHWPDTYKTAYHPTFSDESKYSGIVDRNYNPEGMVGGSWDRFDVGPQGGGIRKFSEDYVTYIPVVGTVGNTLTAINEPTKENIFRAGTSLASDAATFLFGEAFAPRKTLGSTIGKAVSAPFQYGMTRDDIFGGHKEGIIQYDASCPFHVRRKIAKRAEMRLVKIFPSR